MPNELCCQINPTDQCFFCHSKWCDAHYRERRSKPVDATCKIIPPCTPNIKPNAVTGDGHWLVAIGCNLYNKGDSLHTKHFAPSLRQGLPRISNAG